MIILALNCGSSSVKYQVYDWTKREVLCKGEVERIGIEGGCRDHKEAIEIIQQNIIGKENGVLSSLKEVSAVGHRVVHGGEQFVKSVIIDDDVLAGIKKMADLAPLHNPPNILGIEAAKELMPDVPQIAVFDTAFHQTIPEKAFMYATPYNWYKDYAIRRYGFHGTSHLYVSRRASVVLNKKKEDTKVVTMHIGNGTSLAAVDSGKSVDTSMGLTPLEGVMMGTRSGSIDPAIIPFMEEKTGISAQKIDSILNKQSGLFGVTGRFNDRRDIEKAATEGDKRCQLAMAMEAYQLRKMMGSYIFALGGVDAVVFTAGAGELNPTLRKNTLEGLDKVGIILDEEKNLNTKTREEETFITKEESPIKVIVIPTNEEIVLVEDVVAILENRYDVPERFRYSFEESM